MDNGRQVAQYLEELANALIDLQVSNPFHILIAGGAYMLLQNRRRSTEDIDFAIMEVPQVSMPQGQAFRITLKKAEISGNNSTVPNSAEFKQAIEIVARKHKNLPDDWLNDEAAVYYYDDAPHAEVIFWRSFSNILSIYLPTMEYVFATKIAAYRPKDSNDIQMLTQELQLQTREQARAILDTFLLPDAQEFWEVEKKLKRLFP